MTMSSADVGSIQYRELAAAVRGDLITPEDPGYDGARAVYNGMIDKHPATAATANGSPRSRTATTLPTPSTSTRTSSPPASPPHRPGRT